LYHRSPGRCRRQAPLGQAPDGPERHRGPHHGDRRRRRDRPARTQRLGRGRRPRRHHEQHRRVRARGRLRRRLGRSGYQEKHVAITASGRQTITVRLTPRATVSVRKTDGTTVQLDDNSIEFGFSDAFQYRSSTSEDFCRPDGTEINVKREEIVRINGPATLVQSAPCCTAQTVQKVNVTLKAGGATDLFFSDTCNFTRSVDLVGRNHATGRIVFIPFSQIAEVVFP
jgi:hypothetical protein